MDYIQKQLPELNVSLSVGGAERKQNEEVKELYAKADEALYKAKQKKGELRFYR